MKGKKGLKGRKDTVKTFDVQELKQRVDVVDLAVRLGVVVKKEGREYATAFCPFHANTNTPALTLYRDGWKCQAGCGGGDAIALVEKSLTLPFVQAVEWLSNQYGNGQPSAVPMRGITTPRPKASPALAVPPCPEWQTTAEHVVSECVANLAHASAVMRYLVEKRGLTAETIEGARLGWNPKGRKVGGEFWLEEGLTIPLYADGQLWAVNVRTTKEAQGRGKPKYMAMGGSVKNALYGADGLIGARAAVVCEGELDTLLLSQYLPSGAVSITMGGATNLPSNPTWGRYFAAVGRGFLALDNDGAGQAAVEKWRGLFGWVELLPVPSGKDVTDYWAGGGDLAGWVSQLIEVSMYDLYQKQIEAAHGRGDMGEVVRLAELAANEAIRTGRPCPMWVEGRGVVDCGADGWAANLALIRQKYGEAVAYVN